MDRYKRKEKALFETNVDIDNSINVLRPSGISGFIRCPYQWYLTTLLGRRQKPAAATSAGTSVHAGAEYGYRQKIALGTLPKKSEIIDVAISTWDDLNNGVDPLEFNDGESRDKYTDDIAEGLETYYDIVMTVTDPIAVERRYTVELDHPHFQAVSGTLDIVLEDGIVDLKFTKRASTIMHYTLQQSTYAMLREENNEVVNNLYIHNIVRPQAKKGAQVLVGELPKQTDYAKFWIGQILDTVAEYKATDNPLLFRGCSPDNNYLCNSQWCGFWNECPYVKGYRDSLKINVKTLDFDI